MNTSPRVALAVPLLLLAQLVACATPGHHAVAFEGDPERAAVLAVIARSFDAIAAKGPERAEIWREVLLDEGAMTSVRRRDDGSLVTRARSYAEHFAQLAERDDPRSYHERLWEPTVLVDGDIAVVWTPYDFWLDGALSHGGTDVCVLLRTDAGWRIASFAWTVEPDAPPSPLGSPASAG